MGLCMAFAIQVASLLDSEEPESFTFAERCGHHLCFRVDGIVVDSSSSVRATLHSINNVVSGYGDKWKLTELSSDAPVLLFSVSLEALL